MRRCLNLVVVAAAMSISVPALAQSKCPPGAWFCAEAEVQVPQPQLPQAPASGSCRSPSHKRFRNRCR